MVVQALTWAVVVLVVGFFAWRIFIAVRLDALSASHGQPVEFATFELSWKPNQALMAPPGATRATPHLDAPVFAVSPDRLRDAFLSVIAAEPRARVLKKNADGLTFTAVQQTPLMAYPDFVSVEIRPAADGGSTVLIYSRSVFGIRDFGVNRARVEDWVAKVRARLG